MKTQKDPFFIWIHLNEPHDPYTPYKDVKDMYSKHKAGMIDPMKTSREWFNAERKNPDGSYDVSEKDLARMVDLYDAEINYDDKELKVLLYKIDQSGIADNTVIVITSDHGEEFMEHGDLFHGQSLYEELLWIPLIVFVPNQKPKRIEEPVSLTDLYPMIAEFIGISDEEKKLIHDGPVYAETDFRGHQISAYIDGKTKCIHDWNMNTTEEFDLSQDIAESSPKKPKDPSGCLDIISAYRLRSHNTTGEAQISNETRDNLKHLGYIV